MVILISAMLEEREGWERKEEVRGERERLETNNLLASMGITYIPSDWLYLYRKPLNLS